MSCQTLCSAGATAARSVSERLKRDKCQRNAKRDEPQCVYELAHAKRTHKHTTRYCCAAMCRRYDTLNSATAPTLADCAAKSRRDARFQPLVLVARALTRFAHQKNLH